MALVSRLALSDTPALTEPHMKYCHGINPIVLKCFFPCIPFNMGFPLVVISKPVLESAGTFVKKSFEGPTSIDSDSLGKHMYFLVSAPGLGKHFSFLFFLFFFFFFLPSGTSFFHLCSQVLKACWKSGLTLYLHILQPPPLHGSKERGVPQMVLCFTIKQNRVQWWSVV